MKFRLYDLSYWCTNEGKPILKTAIVLAKNGRKLCPTCHKGVRTREKKQ